MFIIKTVKHDTGKDQPLKSLLLSVFQLLAIK